MDISGEQQHGVIHGVSKVRLQSVANGGRAIEANALNLCVLILVHHFPPESLLGDTDWH
jgi:hypothetical protein